MTVKRALSLAMGFCMAFFSTLATGFAGAVNYTGGFSDPPAQVDRMFVFVDPQAEIKTGTGEESQTTPGSETEPVSHSKEHGYFGGEGAAASNGLNPAANPSSSLADSATEGSSMHADSTAVLIKDNLATSARIVDGDIVYSVTDGIYLKRPASDYFLHPGTWQFTLFEPGEIAFGFLFEKDGCPEAHPDVSSDPTFAAVEPLGSEPVAYGDLLGWEYRVDNGRFSGNNILQVMVQSTSGIATVSIGFEHLYEEDLVDLTAVVPTGVTSLYASPYGDWPVGTVKIDNGVFFTEYDSGKPVDIEYYGSGRYVLWIDDFKTFDVMPTLNLVFDASQYGRSVKVVYSNDEPRTVASLLFELTRPLYLSEAHYRAAPDEPAYYSGGIDQFHENTMITAHILGENGARRTVYYIINPKGDFTFPIDSAYEDDFDAQTQALIAKLIGAIQRAEPESTVAFDASALPYLPYYIAEELVRVADKNITLQLTYMDEVRTTSDIASTQVKPPAPGRIYYPLNETGMHALAPL